MTAGVDRRRRPPELAAGLWPLLLVTTLRAPGAPPPSQRAMPAGHTNIVQIQTGAPHLVTKPPDLGSENGPRAQTVVHRTVFRAQIQDHTFAENPRPAARPGRPRIGSQALCLRFGGLGTTQQAPWQNVARSHGISDLPP